MDWDKKTAGILGVLMLLTGFGGSQVLTAEQIENTYVCPLTEEVAIFDRLSGTGKTGYWIENEIEESRKCRTGNVYEPWVLLSEYVETKGVSLNEFLQKKKIEPVEVAQVCGREGCYLCETPIHAYGKCQGTMNYVGEIILP